MPRPSTPRDVLSHYWGYDDFRPRQAEIIDSVLQGRDTLGLLPTGGGKSITFQVPAMLLPGLTVVVTPLISLMKDQVDNLRERGIRAAMVHSGLTRAEHRLAIDRCRLGKAKILYLSPEKLQSKSFIAELEQIDVSLLVVDEAHCISQWGYDFRPSYLRIAQLRKLFPDAPVLALTASATPQVADDIMEKLEFTRKNVFARSFARDNISYVVRYADHKPQMLLRVLLATQGSSIVYVRSRRRTREIAEELTRAGISADFYHAGLASEDKNEKQNRWKAGDIRVMVATNAFGMGIDKPDVRTVIHIDPPSSLEEYYQEAGRAGRDGLPSYAVVIASRTDKAVLTRRLNESFPDKETIRRVYELAGNFLDVAVGSGYNSLFEFDFGVFCDRFGLKPVIARNALLLLTRAGYIEYVDEIATRTRVMIIMTKAELYTLRLDEVTDSVFQFLLRTYTGLFADYVYIDERQIASRLGITEEKVYNSLLTLSRAHAIHFVPRKITPYLLYTASRQLPKHVVLPRAVYEDMRSRMEQRIEAMKRFIFTTSECRASVILNYFGQTDAKDCGNCDVCRDRRKSQRRVYYTPDQIRQAILHLAAQPQTTVAHIAEQLSMKEADIIPYLREMMDEGLITACGTVIKTVVYRGF